MGDSAQQGKELLCSTGASHPPLSPREPLLVPGLTPQGCWISHISLIPAKFSCLPWDGSGPRGQQRKATWLVPPALHPCPAMGIAQHRELQDQEVSVQLPHAQPHLPGRSQVESGFVLYFPHTSVCTRAFLRAGTQGKWSNCLISSWGHVLSGTGDRADTWLQRWGQHVGK